MFDLSSKTWSEIPSAAIKNPTIIAHVAGFLIKQLDTSVCDAVIISYDAMKMFICR